LFSIIPSDTTSNRWTKPSRCVPDFRQPITWLANTIVTIALEIPGYQLYFLG
jgi:hypothetical protein